MHSFALRPALLLAVNASLLTQFAPTRAHAQNPCFDTNDGIDLAPKVGSTAVNLDQDLPCSGVRPLVGY